MKGGGHDFRADAIPVRNGNVSEVGHDYLND
jgi:hypothetical protein